MNITQTANRFRKARRNFYSAPPELKAITSLVTVGNTVDANKVILNSISIQGKISFYLSERPIVIHGVRCTSKNGYKDGNGEKYLTKLALLESVLLKAQDHIKSKANVDLNLREFLNDGSDSFGSTIMIYIPVIGREGCCVLEMSSCHFKTRLTLSIKDLQKHLKFILKHLNIHQSDYKEGMLLL